MRLRRPEPLTAIDLPTPGQDLGFTYDTAPTACAPGETFATGRLSGFTDPSGSTAYCYDRRGNVVRKVQSVTGTPDASVGYTHNAADRLVAMTYPSGAVVTYQRDAAGRITGVMAQPTAGSAAVTVVSDVDYLPFGPATLLTFGNGRTLDKTYDANYGIAAIADSAVDGLTLDYTLDAVGNVTGLDERLAGGGTATRSIDYDDLDRLEALKDGATPIQTFTYDATGNRTSKTAGSPEAYTYPTTSHRLTQTGATARGYDAAGNTTTIGTGRVFTYDDRGRMSQLTDGGVLTREYGYNARGERVVKRNPTVTNGDVTYVYDETGRLLGEYDEAGARIKEYVWLDCTLVAVLGPHGGSSHQYVLTDHLGTPRAVVHPGTNAIVWRWDLTGNAFGDHAANEDPDGDTVAYTFNLRYPGQYFDAETGLHYNYFRDYDPSTGRYVQSDPIGLGGGISTFSYVGSDPLGWIDVDGNERKKARRGNKRTTSQDDGLQKARRRANERAMQDGARATVAGYWEAGAKMTVLGANDRVCLDVWCSTPLPDGTMACPTDFKHMPFQPNPPTVAAVMSMPGCVCRDWMWTDQYLNERPTADADDVAELMTRMRAAQSRRAK